MNHHGTQTLKTERLTLRRFTLDDASAMYHNWANDPSGAGRLTWQPHASEQATRELLEMWCAKYDSPLYYNWAIEFEGEVIGNVEVMGCDGSYGMIGYALGAAYWNKGIMTEAVKCVLTFLLDREGLRHITVKHAPSNPASGKVAAKCGMSYVGTEPFGRTLSNGTFVESLCVYEIRR